jgi:hypothetical protein
MPLTLPAAQPHRALLSSRTTSLFEPLNLQGAQLHRAYPSYRQHNLIVLAFLKQHDSLKPLKSQAVPTAAAWASGTTSTARALTAFT